MEFRQHIKSYKDFPKAGINFLDICPLLKDPKIWNEIIQLFKEDCYLLKPNLIAGIEARGFLLGASLATSLGIGFTPIRKKGKLPGKVITKKYELEYGEASLEIQESSFSKTDRVFVVDDLLATGGTALAAIELIEQANSTIVGIGFIIELINLQGRNKINGKYPINSLITYK